MASGLFNVAISGLNAAQYGLQTTGHNISNASTAGYNRQQIVQTTNTPLFTGGGFLGQGTTVQTVQRVYSQYLSTQLLSAQTGASEMDSYKTEIDQIDNLLADSSAGLSPALSDFFNGVQAVAANPADTAARQSMLSASQELVSRFQSLNQRIQEVRDGVNSQVSAEVSAVNSYAQQIAQLNQRIIDVQAGGSNQPPNDLLDQRDQLISELNKEVRVTTTTQSDGTYNVFIGNGEPLVVGTLNYTMQAVATPTDPERITIALKSPIGGGVVYMPESQVTGGKLGGLVAFRSQTLDGVQNGLGRIALTLAQNFNDQHQLGQDLNGAMGGNYFDLSLAGPTVYANANNTGSGKPAVTISNAGNLTNSDYQLTYDGANYTLLRLSDNAVVFSGASLPQTVDGMTIAAGTWTPAASDSVLIQPTRAAAGNLALAITDPRAIAAAAPIRTDASLANTGTGSIDPGSVVGPPPTNANLQDSVTITFTSATSFDVYDNTTATALATGVAYTPGNGATVSYNGWTAKLSGAPAANDTFTIGPNSNGVSDSRNAVLLAGLQTQNMVAGGSATYTAAYAQIVSTVGNTARQVEVTGQAQQSLADQAQTARDQQSGVNLDEEAANLLRYQQAYQAAAKIFDISGKLFDQILAMP